MYDLAEYPPYLAPCFPSYLNEKILAGIDLVPGENEIIKYSHTVQFSHSVMSDSLWPQGLQHARHPCPTPTPGVLLKLMSIESVMPSNHLILCHSLLLLPSIFQSIRVFSNESLLHTRWPKYWSFSFSISPPNEYPELISFRMDWLDLLAVQGTSQESSPASQFKSAQLSSQSNSQPINPDKNKIIKSNETHFSLSR